MDLKIDVDKEAVEKSVAKAIIESSIGEHINSAINKLCSDYNMQKAIENTVRTTINKIIVDLIDGDRDRLEGIIKEKMSTQVMDTISRKAWDQYFNSLGPF